MTDVEPRSIVGEVVRPPEDQPAANTRHRAGEPLVSVGLPVYNAERFLPEALDCLLRQSYERIEIVISDNASTDGTATICRRAADADPRIRYVRNRTNVGAAGNFNQTFRLSNGPYFKFAAHDDLVAPELIERCVDHLRTHDDVVLCHSRTVPIDENRNRTGPARSGPRVDSTDISQRFRMLMRHPFWATPLFGVARADALERTQLYGPYMVDDHVLMTELCLLGKFHELTYEGFFQRTFAGREQHKSSPRARLTYSHPRKADTRFPRLQLINGYRRVVARSDLDSRERLNCYAAIGRWIATRAFERMAGVGSAT